MIFGVKERGKTIIPHILIFSNRNGEYKCVNMFGRRKYWKITLIEIMFTI